MFFDAKLLTVTIFIIINFLIIILVKTRTTTVTSLIIAHLILVLFLSLSISNYNSFKEIVLSLVAYSMVILFLISNYNPIFLEEIDVIEEKYSRFFTISSLLVAAFVIFFLLFGMIKNTAEIAQAVQDKKFEKQNEIMSNPMILPSHAVHIAVKKFYLGKSFINEEMRSDELLDKAQIVFEINQTKKARLKDKLSDNFLLKRSSDVIVIIVAIITSILLLSKREIKINS